LPGTSWIPSLLSHTDRDTGASLRLWTRDGWVWASWFFLRYHSLSWVIIINGARWSCCLTVEHATNHMRPLFGLQDPTARLSSCHSTHVTGGHCQIALTSRRTPFNKTCLIHMLYALTPSAQYMMMLFQPGRAPRNHVRCLRLSDDAHAIYPLTPPTPNAGSLHIYRLAASKCTQIAFRALYTGHRRRYRQGTPA